jgi:amino acid transporter
MNESGGQHTEHELIQNDHVAEMTRDERVVYWCTLAFVVMMTIISTIMAFYVVFIANKKTYSDKSTFWFLWIVSIIMFVMFFCGCMLVCFKILRRKMKTGNYLPTGERLVKWRKRGSKPKTLPEEIILTKITNVLMMIFPISITFEILTSNRHNRMAGIILFFFLWLLAAISAIGAFMPAFIKKRFPGKPEELQPSPESESR